LHKFNKRLTRTALANRRSKPRCRQYGRTEGRRWNYGKWYVLRVANGSEVAPSVYITGTKIYSIIDITIFGLVDNCRKHN